MSLGLIRACLARGLAIDLSYRTSLALELVDVLLGIVAFFFFSRIVGDGQAGGYEAFAFILVGVAANNAMSTALVGFAQSIRADQQSGAIKPVLASPVPAAAVVACGAAYPMARGLASAGASLAAGGLLFGGTLFDVNVAAALVVGFVAAAALAALGMVSAVFTLVLKRGDPLVWLLTALAWLLGGVLFPVSVLPPLLQDAARLMPIMHATDALRATLLSGADLAAVRPQLVVLGAIAAVGLPLGAALIELGTARVKRTGSLGHY